MPRKWSGGQGWRPSALGSLRNVVLPLNLVFTKAREAGGGGGVFGLTAVSVTLPGGRSVTILNLTEALWIYSSHPSLQETEVGRGQTGVPAPCERPLPYEVRSFKSPGWRFALVAWCRARLALPRVPDPEVGVVDDSRLSLDKAADLREQGSSSLSGEVIPPA